MHIPALVLGYRSGLNIQNRVAELRKQGFSPIFLFIDGPVVDSTAFNDVIETHVFAAKLHDKGEVDAIYLSDTNLGQGVAIPTAIDWFLDEVGAGLILEDDCQISTNTYSYLASVRSLIPKISGCFGACLSNLDVKAEVPKVITSRSTLFFNSWGWYTTLEKWQSGMISNPSNLELYAAIGNLRALGVVQRIILFQNWYRFLLRKRYRNVNTWAFNFTIGVLSKKGFFLMPTTNLVLHLADSKSVHVKKVPSWYQHVSDSKFTTVLNVDGQFLGFDPCYEKFMAREVHQAGFIKLLRGLAFAIKSNFAVRFK